MERSTPDFLSASHGATSNSGAVAPMPGVIEKVNAAVGQTVQEGDALLVMIAMKMEVLDACLTLTNIGHLQGYSLAFY